MPRSRSRSRSVERKKRSKRRRSSSHSSMSSHERSSKNYKRKHRKQSRSPDRIKRESRSPETSGHHRRRESGDHQRGPKDLSDRNRAEFLEKFRPDDMKWAWGKKELYDKKEEKPVEMEKPSFEPSGKLAADTNTYKGVIIKYNEPPDAKLPKTRWRLYPFKGDEALSVIYIHRQSAYLVGRDRKISDFPIDHPSCSKQHAAIQYRTVLYERPDGTKGRRTKPYIMDLGSANGTYLNNERIEAQRYYELKEQDVIKFGFSTREFVLLHEHSADKMTTKERSDSESEEESDEVKKEAKDADYDE